MEWLKTGKHLPHEGQLVLVMIQGPKYKFMYVAEYDQSRAKWFEAYTGQELLAPEAWAVIPPYKEL